MHKIDIHMQQLVAGWKLQQCFVAVSGGLDSMVLLHALVKAGVKVGVLHVNYQLRGEDSQKDQYFIEAYCQEKKIEFNFTSLDLKKKLERDGGNLQQEARNIRYLFFRQFSTSRTWPVALAHHADDQVETFFINLARKSGMAGLACMPVVKDVFIRPLLPFFRKEIAEYAAIEGIHWREDASNCGFDYARNRLRHVFIPQMLSKHPDLKKHVLFIIDIFQQNRINIEHAAEDVCAKIDSEKQLNLTEFDTLSDDQLMAVIRKLGFHSGILGEWKKLRLSEKGKRIEFHNNAIRQIIRENNSFSFIYNIQYPIPALHIEEVNSLPSTYNKMEIYVDPRKIKGDLTVRKWLKNDRIKPLGMQGSRRIAHILKDAHVPYTERQRQWVVTDEEKILWCVGYTVSREAIPVQGRNAWKISLVFS
jgi:tRNA(Ile)-lysidine synthase